MIGPILGGFRALEISDATATITCDGDSLTAGTGHAPGPGGSYPAQLAALPVISGRLNITNLGTSGHTVEQMIATASEADARYTPGKKNILFLWGGTNNVDLTSQTAAQIAQSLSNYVSGRLAINPGWVIFLITVLPMILAGQSQASTDDKNARIDALNTLIRANHKAWGAYGVIDIRSGDSPFNMPNYLPASFETPALMQLWATATEPAGMHLHLNSAGMAFVAQKCAAALKRLPAR